MNTDHHAEPAHQPLAPADRADGGQRLPVEVHASGLTPDHQLAAAANPQQQAANLLYVLGWMQAAGLRASNLQVLLAIGCGHHTPAEICSATNLSSNGVWCALRTLRGIGRTHLRTADRGPRNEPLIGRQLDPHGGRHSTYRYGLTPDGDQLLAWLTDPTTTAPPVESIQKKARNCERG